MSSLTIWALCAMLACPSVPLTASPFYVISAVNGEGISHQDVLRRLKLNLVFSGQEHLSKTQVDHFYPQILQTLIDEKIQRKAAQGIKIPEAYLDERLSFIEKQAQMEKGQLAAFLKSRGLTLQELREQIETALMWAQYIEQKFANLLKISFQDIQRGLKKWKQDYDHPLFYRLAEIVIYVGSDLNQAKNQMRYIQQLLNSGISFRALAQQFSQAPSRDQGGELGWRGLGRIEPALYPWIERAEPGTIVGPLGLPLEKRPKKLVIVAVLDKKRPQELSLEMPNETAIKERLRAELIAQYAREELEKLRRNACIERFKQPNHSKNVPLKTP